MPQNIHQHPALVSAVITLFFSIPALCQAGDEGMPTDSLSLSLDNDLVTGADRDYSNGIGLIWSSVIGGNSWQQWLADALPFPANKRQAHVSIGQNMYTPGDLRETMRIPHDRPYAGFLYASLGIHGEDQDVLDYVGITFGVIGPWSLAAETQTLYHDLIDEQQPRGWQHQLQNEFAATLTYQRQWRNVAEYSVHGLQTEFLPFVGMNLGTQHIDATFGGTLRAGINLKNDYGIAPVHFALPNPSYTLNHDKQGTSYYLFISPQAHAVARNIFLDGNLDGDSHSVSRNPVVGRLQIGAAADFDTFKISYAHHFLTKEYEQQTRASSYGRLTLSRNF